MKDKGQVEETPMGPIVVTIQNLDIGQAINQETVKVEQWPLEKIPPGAIIDLAELEGKYARQYMFPGEPLLAGKLMDSNKDNDAAKIPMGYRVAAVKVTEESAVANLINPGDRVDVIATVNGQTGRKKLTKTILTDVRVFAVNSETSRASEMSTEDRIDAKTVSLLVKPNQVQMIALAEQIGDLELSLRHPEEEASDEGTETLTIDALLGDDNGSNKSGPKPKRGAIRDTLLSFMRPKPQTEAAPEEPEEAPFQMQVLTPDHVSTWVWKDEAELPELVGDTSSAPAAAAPTVPAVPAVPGLPGAPQPPVPSGPYGPFDAIGQPIPPAPQLPDSPFVTGA